MGDNSNVHAERDAALALVAKLRSEKAQHAANFSELQSRCAELQEVNNELQQQLSSTLEAQRKSKALHEQALFEAQAKTDRAAADVEALQGQYFSADDVSLLRAKLVAEVEAQQRGALDAASQEAESYRRALAETQRELRLLRAEHDHLAAGRGALEVEADAVRQAELQDMAKTILALRTQLKAGDKGEEVVSLRHQTSELALRVTRLTDEAEGLRSQLEMALQERDAAIRQQTRAASDAETTCSALENEKETLRAATHRLREEADMAKRRQDLLAEQLHTAQLAATSQARARADTEHALHREIDAAKVAATKARSKWEDERAILRGEIEALTQARDVADECVAACEKRAKEQARAASEKLHVAREEEWAKQLAASEERAALEQKFSLLQRDHSELEARLNRELEIAQADSRRAKASTEALRAEHIELQAKETEQGKAIRVLELAREQAKAVADQLNVLREAHRALQADTAQLQAEHEQVKAVSAMRASEIAELHSTGKAKEEAAAKEASALRAAAVAAAAQHDIALAKVHADMKIMSDKFQALAEAAAQSKSMARREAKQLRAEIKDLEEELAAKNKALVARDREIAALQARLGDMERRVEAFCSAVESEGRRQAAGLFKRPESGGGDMPMPHQETFQDMEWTNVADMTERLRAWKEGQPNNLPRVATTQHQGTAPVISTEGEEGDTEAATATATSTAATTAATTGNQSSSSEPAPIAT